MDNCNCHTDINRDGSGQLTRFLNALDPSYAAIDGRSIEDLLVFAKKYAAQIRFYDIPESKIDDPTPPAKVSWKEFFRRDMAVIASSIAIVDLNQVKKDYDELRAQIDLHPNASLFADLFDPILGMAIRMDHWYTLAIPGNPLKNELDLGIASNLHDQMKKILAYEAGFKLYVDPKRPLKLDYSKFENDALWGIHDTVTPESVIYDGVTPEDRMQHAALFVDDIFQNFFGFTTKLVNNATDYLQFALEEYPGHQPHMALFISFLELFRLAQQQMNGITGRMLDYYYRDILHLVEKPSIPDKVHILFELAKDVTEYDLPMGTALNGGKDASGKPQVYTTENDFVINQAVVKELKTIFIEKAPSVVPGVNTKNIQAIYASPVANSLDGFGEKFKDPYPKWPTFGKGQLSFDKPQNICEAIDIIQAKTIFKNDTTLGFALASPQLVLTGGNRLISWKLDGLNDIFYNTSSAGNVVNVNQFQVWLTGKDGWITVDQVDDASAKLLSGVIATGLFDPAIAQTSGFYIDQGASTLNIYLPVPEQPVIPFDINLHSGRLYETDYPVMQVMIGPSIRIDEAKYKALRFSDQALSVKVGSINTVANKKFDPNFDGLKVLTLQNDDGILASNKPFDPFTAFPKQGNALYVGSDEVFNKPLDQLAVNIRHVTKVIDNSPQATFIDTTIYAVSLLQNKQWINLSNPPTPSFNDRTLAQNILFTSTVSPQGIPTVTPLTTGRTPLSYSASLTDSTVKGFIQIENNFSNFDFNAEGDIFRLLTNDAIRFKIKEISVSYHSNLQQLEAGIDQFFHVYPFGVIETYVTPPVKSLALKPVVIVRPPGIGRLKINRNAFPSLDEQKDFLLVDAADALLPQFTWMSPYSQLQTDIASLKAGNTLPSGISSNKLPDPTGIPGDPVMNKIILEASGTIEEITGGNNQYSNNLQEEGMLFIGLDKAKPLQNISLLFQFAEGSAVDEDDDAPPIHWSYLSFNEWRPLKGEHLISDGTFGFQTTGIVNIEIPADASTHNTIITDGLIWLQASVAENSNRIPQLVNVVAQAVEAIFVDNGNAQSHFDNPLPAGSIGKLVTAVAEVSKVQQPFASFDGKHKEAGKEFYTRVSERLRHKARPVTAWDYEHIILDRFPSIYKVKCITHTDPNCLCRKPSGATSFSNAATCCGPQVAPGKVLVVPIANVKNRNAANPLQPKTSRRTLLEIQQYLQLRISPFVKVYAKNPVYEQVIVAFKVSFYSGTDKGYYLKKLNDEIVHFLTPWAFEDSTEVKFGQKIYASSIINFIEERPYVDFITDFLMGVCRHECCPPAPKQNTGEGNNQTLADILSQVHNCDDMEYLLEVVSDLIGDVVAIPSTPRSILVSVPKHIIIPFEPPVVLSPCEKRKATGTALVTRTDKLPATPGKVALPTDVSVPAVTEEATKNVEPGPATEAKANMGEARNIITEKPNPEPIITVPLFKADKKSFSETAPGDGGNDLRIQQSVAAAAESFKSAGKGEAKDTGKSDNPVNPVQADDTSSAKITKSGTKKKRNK